MELKDILKQLAGESEGVGMVVGSDSESTSGELAFIQEVLGAYQRCTSKLKATMAETGITANDITDEMAPILAMGYLAGCVHISERMTYKALPRQMAIVMENVQWIGNRDGMELYFKVLEKAVANYADSTTITDIQDHDPEGFMAIANYRKELESKLADAARPAHEERKRRGSAAKSKVN